MDGENKNKETTTTEENTNENVNNQNTNEDTTEDITFDDVLTDPEFKKEFDRRITKAINTYDKTIKESGKIIESSEYEKLKNESAQSIKDLKFELALTKAIAKTNPNDDIGYKAHLDIAKLKETFNEETGEISAYFEMAESIKANQSHFFKSDNLAQSIEINKFSADKEPENLNQALKQKFEVK